VLARAQEQSRLFTQSSCGANRAKWQLSAPKQTWPFDAKGGKLSFVAL